jgi:hypothetical protein
MNKGRSLVVDIRDEIATNHVTPGRAVQPRADGRSPAARVRASIDAERLPAKAWIGYGSTQHCDGCGETILKAHLEYDVEILDESAVTPQTISPISKLFRLHAGCYGLWLGELIRRGSWKPQPPSSQLPRRRIPGRIAHKALPPLLARLSGLSGLAMGSATSLLA